MPAELCAAGRCSHPNAEHVKVGACGRLPVHTAPPLLLLLLLLLLLVVLLPLPLLPLSLPLLPNLPRARSRSLRALHTAVHRLQGTRCRSVAPALLALVWGYFCCCCCMADCRRRAYCVSMTYGPAARDTSAKPKHELARAAPVL